MGNQLRLRAQRLSRRSAVSAAVALALAMSGAHAATAPDQPPEQLQQIVVTARYTKENLEQTPMSITALDASQLKERGASNIVDIASSTPNVTLMTGGSTYGNSALAFIRGVGQVNFNPAFEPAVGFYVDDVYQGQVFGSLFDLGDVQSVELLRGPQGTLFGMGNEAGAILITTPTPSGGNKGYAEVGYGNYNQERLRGAFDTTLIPGKLFMRVAGGSEQSDGWFKRYSYPCLHPSTAGSLPSLTAAGDCLLGTEGGQNVDTGSLALRYMASDDLDVIVRADVTNDRSQPAPTRLVAVDDAPGTGINDYNTHVAIPMFGVPLDSRFLTSNPYTSYATYEEPSTGRIVPQESTSRTWGVSGTLNWHLGGDIQVKNIVGFRHVDGAFAINGAEAPIPTFDILQAPWHDQYTEELHVSGTAIDHRLEWTVGAFYYNAYTRLGGYALLPGLEIVPPGILPFAPGGVYGLDFLQDDEVQDRNTSEFGHAIFHITKRLSLEAGVRYTRQSKGYTFIRTSLATNPLNPLFPAGSGMGGINGLRARASTNRVDPKLALQYQWTPQWMTYLQASTGYKGAGINPEPVFGQDVKPFGPEEVIAYEAGLKGQWLENRLRVNSAVFHSDYRNLQQNYYAADGSLVTVNTGRMFIDGAELELSALPVGGLELDTNVGYLHFHTVSLGLAANLPAGTGPTLSTVPPYVPKVKLSVGAQYAIDLGAAGVLTPRLDWAYQTQVYNDVPNLAVTRQPGYGLANARLTYDSPDGNWQAALEAKNLFDKLYYVNMTDFLLSYGTLDGQPGPPRMILFTVRRSF